MQLLSFNNTNTSHPNEKTVSAHRPPHRIRGSCLFNRHKSIPKMPILSAFPGFYPSLEPKLYILNLPVDRFCAIRFQKLVALAEMPAAKETAVCRQRTRMRRFQDQMLRIRQHRNLTLCRPPPEQIDNGPVLCIDSLNHGIRKLFPSLTLMGIGLMGTHGQYRIQQKHP